MQEWKVVACSGCGTADPKRFEQMPGKPTLCVSCLEILQAVIGCPNCGTAEPQRFERGVGKGDLCVQCEQLQREIMEEEAFREEGPPLDDDWIVGGDLEDDS